MRERGQFRAVVVAAAAILACGALLAACGDDDEETTVTETVGAETTGAETETIGTEATSGEACPDVPFFDSTITNIRSTVGCDLATAVATDVLGRDDCVEESPSGSNECESNGYTCTTVIGPAEGMIFGTNCDSPAGTVSFQQTLPRS